MNPTVTPWLQAVLPLAFRRGEAIEVDGEVDARWLENARNQMRVWNGWFPELEPIEIRAARVRSTVTAPNVGVKRTGLFFTGGIDSFYSLFRYDQVARDSGADPIADLIYVCGYDIPLTATAALQKKIEALSQVARALGKELVILSTNLRETRLKSLDWGLIEHGPGLGAAGLLLGNRWNKALISAGGCIDNVTAWGSHPLTDPLMSSGATEIIRYANNVTRFAKTEFLSDFDLALEHLHVCWVRHSHDNCGECEKCIRTMLMLEVCGVLSRATCFPPGDLLQKLKGTCVTNALAVPLWEDIRDPAVKRGRGDLAREIELCLERSRSIILRDSEPGFLRNFERRVRKTRKALLG